MADWIHTEINVWHRELNLGTVTRLSTNRARRGLTSPYNRSVQKKPSFVLPAKIQIQSFFSGKVTFRESDFPGKCP